MQNDRSTSYETYLAVYNEIKAAYNEAWDKAARERFGNPYRELSTEAQREVRKEIPLVISEAEPTEYGEEGD